MRTWNYLTFGEGLCVEAVCNRYYRPMQDTACGSCPMQAACKEYAGKELSPIERQSWEARLARIAESVIDTENRKPRKTERFHRVEARETDRHLSRSESVERSGLRGGDRRD